MFISYSEISLESLNSTSRHSGSTKRFCDTKALRNKDFGEKFICVKFSENQRRLLQEIGGAVTVVETFAGGSKTTILLTLIAWLLMQHTELLLIVTSTNKRTVSAIIRSIQEKLAFWQCNRAILMMRCDHDDVYNNFEQKLQQQRTHLFDGYKYFYTVLDADLSTIVSVLLSASLTQDERLAIRLLALKLLALRFEHLERLVYPAFWASHLMALDKVGCLGMSCDELTQLNAETSEWTKHIFSKKKLVLFQDEYQKESPETGAIMLQGVEAAVLAGDHFQALCLDVDCQQQESADLRTAMGQQTDAQASSPRPQPLSSQSTSKWSHDNPNVQYLVSLETFRTCEPGLTIMREIFGGLMDDCIAGTTEHSTHYFPILVHPLTDWHRNLAGENIASGVLFSAVLLLVSLELVVATSSRRPISIAVHCYMLGPLFALEQYLKKSLPESCERIRLSLKVDCEDTYGWCVETLKKRLILQFCGPCDDGVNAIVSIPLFHKHAVRDRGWWVSVSQTCMLYSALSRGSCRIYPLIEDLRFELCVPVTGEVVLDRRVTQLGLRTTTTLKTVNKTWVRAQLSISHACAVFEKYLTDINCKKWLTSEPMMAGETCFFPAILTSHNLKELLGIPDLPWADYTRHALILYNRLHFNWPNIQRQEPRQTLSQFFGSKHFEVLLHEEDTHDKADQAIQVPYLQRYVDRLRPSDDWLAVFWKTLMIDAVSVSIINSREAIVQIPVAAQLPRVCELAQSLGAKGSDWFDPAYLADAIARAASGVILSSPRAAKEMDGVTFQHCVRLHRNDALSRDRGMFFVPLCSSDGPAFIIDAVVKDLDGEIRQTSEVLHLHPCVGLEHAHSLQRVLLARCTHHAVACAVVSAACHLIGFSYKRNLVRCFMDDAEARKEVESQWDLLMESYSLVDRSEDLPAFPRDRLNPMESALLSECLEIARTNFVD